MEIDLSGIPSEDSLSPLQILFSESNSRFVATVSPKQREDFESLFEDVPCAPVGRTTIEPVLSLYWGDKCLVEIPVDELLTAYTETLDNI